jgi:molecular chaperone GrpE
MNAKNQKSDNEELIYADEEGEIDEAQLREKLGKMREKLKRCSEEKQGYLTGWQREKADFINFRRRQDEQMGEWMKTAQAGVLGDILPVIDTLDAGIRNLEFKPLRCNSGELNGSAEKNESHLEGIKKQLMEILKKHGLEEIECLGEKFNPEFHEAIGTVESDKEEGVVIEEAQKGYLLNGKVLRTSKVKVSKSK